METTNASHRLLKGAFSLFLKDLNALPEEAFYQSFGPKVRTIADIVYETNLVNDHVGLTIRGEELFAWPDGWIKAPEGFGDKAAIIAAFQKSSDKIMETALSFTPEQLEEMIVDEGKETTRAERCRFMALHTWYHSGQLNFVQTLLGDDSSHW